MKGPRAALAAVLLTSACTGGGSAKPSPASSLPGEVVRAATTTPVRFGADPLWSDETKDRPKYAEGFTLHGESLVMLNGRSRGAVDRLSVVDAATGRSRWSLAAERPLPGGHGDRWYGPTSFEAPQVVDRGRDWGVLVTTVRAGSTRQKAFGLALLSGEDGHVLWRRPLVAATGSPAHGRYAYPTETLTGDGRIMVSLHPQAGGTLAELKLIAVDALSGRRLWTRTGLRPRALASGSVVAVSWPAPASAPLDDTRVGSVTVLDAATGRTRWPLNERMPTASVSAVVSGLLVVRARTKATLETPIILDLTRGTEVGRMPATTGNCIDDDTTLIACETLYPESRVFTIRSDERRLKVSGHKSPVGLALVKDDRIYYGAPNGPGTEIDRSGTSLAGALPGGYLKTLSGKYAVFAVSTTGAYRVYRVG